MPTIEGTLTFADPPGRPLHHFPIAIRGVAADGSAFELARGETDANGVFVLELPPDASTTTMTLVGLEIERRYDAKTDAPLDTPRDAFVLPIALGVAHLDPIAVPFWSYHPERPVPRAGLNAKGSTDQQHAPGYVAILKASVAAIFPIGSALGKRLEAGEKLTLDDLQDAFPEVLTRRMDRFTGHSRSDAWLGEVVLDGFNTLPMVREIEGERRLAMAIEWGDVPSDGVHDLSDVVALFDVENEKLFPREIRMRLRRPMSATEWGPTVARTFRPGDAEWEEAKHVFRCHYVLSGALDAHIIKTHLLVEQFALAAYRNLRRNPLRSLLFPHLQEVVPADTDADQFAWGPNGEIPVGSALKFPVVEDRMRLLLGQMDWLGWKPRSALTRDHKYARLLDLSFDLIGAYVDDFVATNRAAIAAEWLEVRRFSDELVGRSVPRVAQRPPEGFEWACANEIVAVDVRPGERAISPVVTSDTPTDADFARVAAMARFLLCQATFVHTWVHDGQYDVAGDVGFASLALRNGSLGDLEEVGPLFPEAISALTVNSNGMRTNFGFILANEDGDVPPALRAAVQEHARAFRSLGFDVARLRSRINI